MRAVAVFRHLYITDASFIKINIYKILRVYYYYYYEIREVKGFLLAINGHHSFIAIKSALRANTPWNAMYIYASTMLYPIQKRAA